MGALKTTIYAYTDCRTYPVLCLQQASPETPPYRFALKTKVKTAPINTVIQPRWERLSLDLHPLLSSRS